MKTLLTIAQQKSFIADNWKIETITHKWSTRGYGNSKIIDQRGNVLAKATGCGYDRFGTVIGEFINVTFQNELQRLAKRFCKKPYAGGLRSSEEFYGMFLRKDGSVRLDGACGYNCMCKILNCIGFEIVKVGEFKKTYNGEDLYNLRPVSDHNKKYIVGIIK